MMAVELGIIKIWPSWAPSSSTWYVPPGWISKGSLDFQKDLSPPLVGVWVGVGGCESAYLVSPLCVGV